MQNILMKAGIAGGGIMGQLLAFSLINAGWDVTLFDQSITNNCSMAAAGLLTPIAELEKNDLIIFQLGIEALAIHWKNILKTLGNKVYFKREGSLVVAHPNDQLELIHLTKTIASKLKHNNFYQTLNHAEINQLEPELTKFTHAYYFENEGQIDAQMLLQLLSQYLLEQKVKWLKNSFVSAVYPGRIISNKTVYQFDMVFDCTGLGAKSVFNDLRSIRGELIWLEASNVRITRPIRFLHPRYSLYIVPRPNQIYLIGASEIESHDNSNISVKTMLELLTAIYSVNSKFSEARIIKMVTQCRPTLINHLPKIKYTDALVAVNGLYRHGFLIAPTLVNDIMQWLKGNKITRYQQLWEEYS